MNKASYDYQKFTVTCSMSIMVHWICHSFTCCRKPRLHRSRKVTTPTFRDVKTRKLILRKKRHLRYTTQATERYRQ